MQAGAAGPIGVICAGLLACVIAGCGGGQEDERQQQQATAPGANQPADAGQAPKCTKPSDAAVRALEKTLEVRGRLAAPAGVRSPDKPKAPAFARGGLHFISATIASPEVKPNTVGTWAVSGAFFKTGKGAAAPADFFAGGFAGGDKEDSERAGIDVSTIGYADSRSCQRRG